VAVLETIRARLEDVLETRADDLHVGGAVVGVAIGDESIALAHGCANLNTGQPFTDDTGFLLGSVTKPIVATALMRLVERGALDLDAPVTRYVPEFTLRDREAAERITVRMLLNHTNGMDATWLNPDGVRGRDANKSYVEALANREVLFEPGTFWTYSNPGFVVAARILEEHTGLPFEHAIERELFGPCGMVDATAVQTQAFLRRTAVGAYYSAETGEVTATPMFTLPESLAGAGSTPIVTVADMLAFGRTHLNGGVAPNGQRVLSQESVEAMQAPSFDLGLPLQFAPVGLAWWLVPVAGTTAPWHAGGSPGGASSFCILPEYDAVIVSFATGGGNTDLDDLLHNAAIEELTGRPVTPPFAFSPVPPDDAVMGEYTACEITVGVERDGDALVLSMTYMPPDEGHARTMTGYGVDLCPRRVTYNSVAPGLYAPAEMEYSALGGFNARLGLLLAPVPEAPGRRAGLHHGVVYIPKAG
jgi:CubicO group peptidase (beta-lactamase class C family)